MYPIQWAMAETIHSSNAQIHVELSKVFRMDALTGLLAGPRAQGAFLLRSVLDSPWSIRVEDEAPLTVVAVVRGAAWLIPRDAEPRALRPGGVAILRGPDHYTVADTPTRPPTVFIRPGQVSTTIAGEEVCEVMDLGQRSWGTGSGGHTMMLTGTYQTPSEVSRLLLRALPPVIVLSEKEWTCPFLDLLGAEMAREAPGQELVLDRLLDLILIDAMRAWLARSDSAAPTWYRAIADGVVGTALRLIHDEPAQPWTVALLARAAGVSRAALARRFTDLVGIPPMAYLTEWRLALAADMLREPAETIGSVARKVGYGSAFALSTAFKRIRGVSPQHHRMALVTSA
jgi:AraC-like DNA-binding protein